jgi:copper chaperone CopZ
MKKFILFAALMLISSSAYATETAKISVNGLVCDFCVRAIEKIFGKEDAVKSVTVDLTAKLVTAAFKDGQTLSDEKLKTMVTNAGYNVVDIKREKTDE